MSRKTGVNFNSSGSAEVRLWAPKCTAVSIVIENKQAEIALQKKTQGFWFIQTNDIKPGDRYKFLLDQKDAWPDPASLSQPDGVHHASEAIDLAAYNWTDNHWKNIDQEKYILYELHVGTFSSRGDFKGLEEKLAYLKKLGINAIEIMPIAQFPGNRNWGYDGVFPFAVQNSYGGPAALQHLVDKCHQNGMGVILDVVYNHLGPEGNYLDIFGHYFTDKYNTPWGKAINFDDGWCDGVREYFIENALMWFRDFHIDALRLDAVHAIKDLSPKHLLKEIKEQVDLLMQASGRRHYLIVEMDLNDTRFINPINKCGYGLDAQWVDEFHHALRVASGNEQTGYYEDFNGLHHLAKSYMDAYVYDGMYSPHRKKMFGVKASGNPGNQFIVFSQNHDQVGNRMLGERTSQLVSFEMQKLMAGAVFCSPFLPMLFMGEEYGETNPFLYFVSHTDEALAKAVREGRRREFASFHGEGEAPDPNAIETFEQSKLQWQLLEQQPHKALFNYYKFLIETRKSEPALHLLDRKLVKAEVEKEQQLLILERGSANNKLICMMNFSKQPQRFEPASEGGHYIKLVDSAAVQWNGPGETALATLTGEKIAIQPESIVIYKRV